MIAVINVPDSLINEKERIFNTFPCGHDREYWAHLIENQLPVLWTVS